MERAVVPETEITEYRTRRVGEAALWGAGVFTKELGVNDPLAHLEQYLERGEAAIDSIDEDLITDCAERMVKPKFINRVDFDRIGDDFVSRENKFSMRAMTRTTEYKFASVADMRLYERARIESKEVDRLNEWFDDAKINDVYIVTSMPMTESETYTIVRIHQKTGVSQLNEHVLTLHNSNVDIFNQLHAQLGAAVPNSSNEFELLDNMYSYRPEDGDFEGFIGKYAKAYDSILAKKNPGREFNLGLEKSEKIERADDIDMIRAQAPLRQVYLDSLRALGDSRGYVTEQIVDIDQKFGFAMGFKQSDTISAVAARGLLDNSLQYIVATLNRAPQTTLDKLASGIDVVGSVSYYGGQASAEGMRYEGACPSGSGDAATNEAAALGHGHRKNIDPAQCGTCPNCQKEYFVPDEIYQKKTVHCQNCKAAIGFGGRGPDYNAIREYYHSKTSQVGAFEIIGADLRRIELESDIQNTLQKHAMAGNEFERKKLEKQLTTQQQELQAVRQIA